jgi:hypothetical protein
MSGVDFASLLRRSLAAAAIGLACPVSGFGSDQAAPPELLVEIFPDHYVVGRERVASLEALAARVTASNARTVRLTACGLNQQQLLAVVQRLNRAKVTGFEIPDCGGAPAERVTAPLVTGLLAADSAYLATDQYGRSTMP